MTMMTLSTILSNIDALDARIKKAITHATKLETGAFDEELEVITKESQQLVAKYQELLIMILFSKRSGNHENLSH